MRQTPVKKKSPFGKLVLLGVRRLAVELRCRRAILARAIGSAIGGAVAVHPVDVAVEVRYESNTM